MKRWMILLAILEILTLDGCGKMVDSLPSIAQEPSRNMTVSSSSAPDKTDSAAQELTSSDQEESEPESPRQPFKITPLYPDPAKTRAVLQDRQIDRSAHGDVCVLGEYVYYIYYNTLYRYHPQKQTTEQVVALEDSIQCICEVGEDAILIGMYTSASEALPTYSEFSWNEYFIFYPDTGWQIKLSELENKKVTWLPRVAGDEVYYNKVDYFDEMNPKENLKENYYIYSTRYEAVYLIPESDYPKDYHTLRKEWYRVEDNTFSLLTRQGETIAVCRIENLLPEDRVGITVWQGRMVLTVQTSESCTAYLLDDFGGAQVTMPGGTSIVEILFREQDFVVQRAMLDGIILQRISYEGRVLGETLGGRMIPVGFQNWTFAWQLVDDQVYFINPFWLVKYLYEEDISAETRAWWAQQPEELMSVPLE